MVCAGARVLCALGKINNFHIWPTGRLDFFAFTFCAASAPPENSYILHLAQHRTFRLGVGLPVAALFLFD